MSSHLDRPWRKRASSRSPPPREKYPRHDSRSGNYRGSRGGDRPRQEAMNREKRTQLNQLQEEERMREWVAQEDDFVLRQAKKKAEIRVKEKRAKPIDWLTVTLRLVDPTRDPLDDDIEDASIDIIDPEGVFERLGASRLQELQSDIDTFLDLEKNPKNRDYWKTMKIICLDRLRKLQEAAPEDRAVSSVAADIDKLLSPKTYEQLCTLEAQIKRKLDSDEAIDTDYWEQLLRSLNVWKARAKLKKVYEAVVKERISSLRAQQKGEAKTIQQKLAALAPRELNELDVMPKPDLEPGLDPEPFLQLRPQDKGLEIIDEETLLRELAIERKRIARVGYVPLRHRQHDAVEKASTQAVTTAQAPSSNGRFAPVGNDDFSQATKALYERELARGVSENEEIFTGEEAVNHSMPVWANKYRPRKPRYFNRVQMGYEWNKYNQTHYDYDNPPPKVVMGYKFNIFYPDLIDKTKAPTYKIEREHGRKRGQSFAPAGEEDTCLIRFIAGPPYEDIAFRIVDKEWDYSAKRERGFKSSFDKGILQLHFQFKKIFYRK